MAVAAPPDVAAMLRDEIEQLRNHIDFHRRIRHEIDQLPSEILDGNKKMTLTHILEDFYFNRLETNADGYAYIEPWRYAEYCGEATGTANSHINYLSDVHEDNRPDKLGVLPLFDKRLVKIPDKENGEKEYAYDTYLKPRPYAFETGLYKFYCRKTRNIGGADRGQGRKKKCEKCNRRVKETTSVITQQKSTYCKHCKIKHVYPVERVNLPETVTDDAENQIDFEEQKRVENQSDTVEEEILPHQIDFGDTPIQQDEPITPPPALDANTTLITWLQKRIGERVIYATGDLEQGRKYLYKPEGYTPDIAAYLAGDPEHIYGSRLRQSDGSTWVLAFDFDAKQPEHDKNHVEYMTRLASAGAAPIYFPRRPGRGHLEMYFDVPVDLEAAYQWAIGIVPELAQVECFPCVGNQALSWPLYQRIGDQVTECSVEAMSPEKPDSMGRCKGVQSDPARLAQIVTRCVTKASLVPAIPIANTAQEADGGALLVKPLAYDGDLIDDFNRSHSWDEVASWCGGWSKTGHFKAVWRGERTASVKPDKDERYCCDYGDGYRKYDKYGVWCKVKDIDPATDLREQRASIRQGVAA